MGKANKINKNITYNYQVDLGIDPNYLKTFNISKNILKIKAIK